MDLRPIGLFDSGVGGLTVWRQVAVLLPNEDLLYLADQAHCPYGSRPLEEIRQLSLQAADLLIRQGSKMIVVACNAASAAALATLRGAFPDVPFVGMEPAVLPAAKRTRLRKIGVLATPATLAGDLFAKTRERVVSDVQLVQQTADGLVERIEAGDIDSPETERMLCQVIAPLQKAGVDKIVLGCTHYPFITSLLQKIMGPEVEFIDPSAAVAAQVKRVLSAGDGENDPAHVPVYRFYTSGDPRKLTAVMEKLIQVHGAVEPVILSGA